MIQKLVSSGEHQDRLDKNNLLRASKYLHAHVHKKQGDLNQISFRQFDSVVVHKLDRLFKLKKIFLFSKRTRLLAAL
jgi:hypothetical protein